MCSDIGGLVSLEPTRVVEPVSLGLVVSVG